jgi:hypothetical protein
MLVWLTLRRPVSELPHFAEGRVWRGGKLLRSFFGRSEKEASGKGHGEHEKGLGAELHLCCFGERDC